MSVACISDHMLRVGFLIEPPFGFRAADGAAAGCDIETAARVARDLGLAGIAPVEATFEELLPGLAESRWDMTVALFVTPERMRIADFCRPVWALGDGLLVARGNPRRLAGYGSLAADADARLAAIHGQVQHRTALNHGVPAERIVLFDSYADAAAAVAQGRVDAYASVAMAHRGHLALCPSLPCTVVDVPPAERLPSRGAFAVARGREELRARIDAALLGFLGTPEHVALMARFGFAPPEIGPFA